MHRWLNRPHQLANDKGTHDYGKHDGAEPQEDFQE